MWVSTILWKKSEENSERNIYKVQDLCDKSEDAFFISKRLKKQENLFPTVFEESMFYSKQFIDEMEQTKIFKEFNWSRYTGSLNKMLFVEEDEEERNRSRWRKPSMMGVFGVLRYPHNDPLISLNDTSGSEIPYLSQLPESYSKYNDDEWHQPYRKIRPVGILWFTRPLPITTFCHAG